MMKLTETKSAGVLRYLITCLLAIALAETMSFAANAACTDDESKNEADAAIDAPAYVRMTTSKGDIYLELNRKNAPISVANFVKYVEDEFYDGTIFHRVIPTFMIQGGGFTPEMLQKPTRPPIKNESHNGLSNMRSTIAMARTPDPDSATSQFFINVVDNARLDAHEPDRPGYAVFGRVYHGMDVVDAIRRVETRSRGPFNHLPRELILIEKVRMVTKEEAERAKQGEPTDESEADGKSDPGANDG